MVGMGGGGGGGRLRLRLLKINNIIIYIYRLGINRQHNNRDGMMGVNRHITGRIISNRGRFGFSLLLIHTFLLKRPLVLQVNFAEVGRPRTTFIAKRIQITYLFSALLANSVFIKAQIG